MTGKPGRPKKEPIWTPPERPKPEKPEKPAKLEVKHVQTIELPAPEEEYQGPRTIAEVKDRKILTLQDATEFLSDLINVVKHSEDERVFKKAFTLMNLVNTSIKSIKEQINNSPEGQQQQLNKINALAKLAKGLPASLAKQILLDKNFHLIETIELAQAKETGLQIHNEVRARDGGRITTVGIPDVDGSEKQRDTEETTEKTPEQLERDAERERLEREQRELEAKFRVERLKRADAARKLVATRNEDREILRQYLNPTTVEPSYDADGNAIDTTISRPFAPKMARKREPEPPAPKSPETETGEVWPAELRWLE